MPVTFVKTSNTAAVAGVAGQPLGNTNQDVVVKKLIVGNPVNSGNIALYNITNPLPSFNAANDAQLAFKYTYESSVGSSSTRILDFTTSSMGTGSLSSSVSGLTLTGGGNLMMDQSMAVTVIWDVNESNIS